MSLADLRRKVEAAFSREFGARPQQFVQAPGRVNLIGEHTDYNEGFVLPCAIDRATVVGVRVRADRQLRVLALDSGPDGDAFDLAAPIGPVPERPWSAYVRGMAREALAQQPGLPGMDIVVAGDVPQGAGLSSSASLTVALGAAWQAVGALPGVDPTGLARMAQRAENDFVGCQCGIMDQLVSARGQEGCALWIDCRSLQTRPVPMPAELCVLIAHSRVRRGLVDSHYNERRAACEEAARHFGVRALRDVSAQQLPGCGLTPRILRRARHVVTENARTQLAAAALARGELHTLAALMAESHASMRDDFEITVPAVDRLVAIIGDALAGEGGCRMTGGGFGGCVVALLPQAAATEVERAILRHYRSDEDLPANVFRCQASAGAGPLA